jgi:hypothetical protein
MLCEHLSYKEFDDVNKGEDIPMKKVLLVPLLACLLLSACGEFSYKRGATAADLEKSRDACKANGMSDDAVKKCLEDQGWFVHDLSDMDPVAVLMPNEDNRSSGSQGDVAAAAAATMVESGTPASTASTTPAGAPAAPVKSMTDKFKVTSWWKRGAGRTELADATNQCVAELGEEHRPDPVTQYTTRGLLICMRKSGWYGLASK